MQSRGLWFWAVLWIVTLAGAYLIGSEATSSDPAGATDGGRADTAALQAENERLRRALEARGPVLEAGATGPRDLPADTPPPGTPPPPTASRPGEEPVAAIDLENVETPDELLAQFLAFVKLKLTQGEKGHLELLQTMDELLNNKESQKKLEELFGNEDEAVRYIYPLIRFAVSNEASVVALTETTFKTMAEDPARFEGFDNDTLEFFTEGVGYILPGVISEERLTTFREYAKKILETPEDRQTDAVRRNRNRVERLLRVWAPRLAPEDALAKLQAGDLTPQEALALLSKLPPDMTAEIDVGKWMGPLVETGDYRAMRMMGRLRLTSRQVAECDRHLLTGAEKGRISNWHVRYYLQQTGRKEWADARGLIEQGLNQGGKAVDVFASSVMQIRGRPDAEWVRWMLDSYTLRDNTRTQLKRAFKID